MLGGVAANAPRQRSVNVRQPQAYYAMLAIL